MVGFDLIAGYHGFGLKKISGKHPSWVAHGGKVNPRSCGRSKRQLLHTAAQCTMLHFRLYKCITMLWNVVKIIYNVPHCCTWLDNVVRCNTIVHNVASYSKIAYNVVEEERGQNLRYSRSNGEEREQWIGSTFSNLHWKCSVRFGQFLKALTFSCLVWHHNYPIQFSNTHYSKNPKHFWKWPAAKKEWFVVENI